MKLSELLEEKIPFSFPDAEIAGLTDDSRKVRPGYLFVCVKGNSFDGHDRAKEALDQGAAAVVVERDLGLPRQILSENSRKLYGELCAAWFGHPERRMKLIAVTGTKGKSTITRLIKEILTMAGHKTGLIGTIQNEIGDEIRHTDNTTPYAYDYFALLKDMAGAGCEYVVMEVCSFAMPQYRIGPSSFEIAVFTNLTQDHLDYHGTMEAYYQAKRMLFDRCGGAIVNVDTEYGKRLYGEISCPKYSCSLGDGETGRDFSASELQLHSGGASYCLTADGVQYPVTIRMPGAFNVMNSLQAAAVCIRLGVPAEKTVSLLERCEGVKGRCEVIPTGGRGFTVICDYAHAPDALDNVLRDVRQYTKGRLICLFGCGGNRDRAKRPKMAAAAAKYSDYLLVTSDNPRDEDPMAIIEEILTGLEGTGVPREIVCDRREAIFRGVAMARPGDILVLAGKGHEDYQVLAGNRHIHFDEREIVAEALALLPEPEPAGI